MASGFALNASHPPKDESKFEMRNHGGFVSAIFHFSIRPPGMAANPCRVFSA
jgi:hypothetical protein